MAALCDRVPIAVDVGALPAERLPDAVEAAAYYVAGTRVRAVLPLTASS